jgi:hypothetical protein
MVLAAPTALAGSDGGCVSISCGIAPADAMIKGLLQGVSMLLPALLYQPVNLALVYGHMRLPCMHQSLLLHQPLALAVVHC